MSTQTPGPVEADAAPSAGPGLKPPAPHAGKEPPPGSATAAPTAVCGSPGPDKAGAGASFTLPRRTPLPSFDSCCGGKSLNDGVAAACGRKVTHYPHALDREPGAS